MSSRGIYSKTLKDSDRYDFRGKIYLNIPHRKICNLNFKLSNVDQEMIPLL